MKIKSITESSLIPLHNEDWIEKQRIAGKITSEALNLLKKSVNTNITYLKLSKLAEEFILDNNCTPTFKGYKDFPEAVCISVNEELVHGIPKDINPEEGDVISFDLGATYKSAIADSAFTMILGSPKSQDHVKLINATENSLAKGISNIKIGKRIGCIGNAIYKSAKGDGFGDNLVVNYGGHSLSWDEPHAGCFIANKSNPQDGFVIQSNLTLAIEPMLVLGKPETFVDKDKWTVKTKNISAHFEHTIFIHNDCIEIMTWRQDSKYFPTNIIKF